MSNRTSAIVQAVKRRKRAVVNTVSVGAIGVLAVGTLSTGVATAQDMVGSGDIQRDAVGAWQLKGANDGQTPAVGSHHIINNTIGFWDMGENSVGPRIIGPHAVQEGHLSEPVQEKLNDDGGGGEIPENSVGKRELDEDTVGKLAQIGPPKAWSMTDLDNNTDLPNDQVTQVATLNVSGPVKVNGHVTVSGEQQNNNMVCSLTTDARDGNIAEANEKVSAEGQQNASMTLTGVANEADTSTVIMNCSSGNGGFATDVTLNATQVAPASDAQPMSN